MSPSLIRIAKRPVKPTVFEILLPPQYPEFNVDGVPPANALSVKSSIFFSTHSPVKPFKRRLPVRSSCIAPVLTAFFFAISLSKAVIKASVSDNAFAISDGTLIVIWAAV